GSLSVHVHERRAQGLVHRRFRVYRFEMQYGWSDGSRSAELGEIVPWKAIVRAQPSPIASAPAGLVKLMGVVNPIDNHALVAPLSGAPCVWWRVIVDSKRGS